ncbi:hypothetical protein [Algivirga pacifica]|uniref:Caspase domain-containing protein n=1 Tax=Algivirga pacifica TaxID=1162670 RepID=A0ABP9D7P6_9BACT
MSLSLDVSKTKAILIGVGKFPKDPELLDRVALEGDFTDLAKTFQQEEIIGLSAEDVTTLINEDSSTQIKEEIAIAAEEAKDTLIVYYSGYVIVRKGKLFFATTNSTQDKAHVNGIALEEILNILKETEAKRILFMIDANYKKIQVESGLLFNDLLKNIFEEYRKDMSAKLFLSTPVDENLEGGLLTKEFISILNNGIHKQAETLTLKDIHDSLSTALVQQADGNTAVILSAVNTDAFHFAYNLKFIEFKRLKEQGDALFEAGEYEKALPIIEQAHILFPEEEICVQKKSFIGLIQQAQEAFEQKAYQESYTTYVEASKLFDLEIVREGMIQALSSQADIYFNNEDFENAKNLYEQLKKLDKQNELFANRLEHSLQEMRFVSLRDQGDSAYFQNDYETALAFYMDSLSLHFDHVVQRRKEECERLVRQKQELSATLRDEIRAEVAEELQAQAPKEVTPEIDVEAIRQEIRTEERTALEESFWQNASFWNAIEGYEFYLNFFAEGVHREKAQERIEELKKEVQAVVTTEELPTTVESTDETEIVEENTVQEDVVETTASEETLAEEEETTTVAVEETEPTTVAVEETESTEEEYVEGLNVDLLKKLRTEPIEDIIWQIQENVQNEHQGTSEDTAFLDKEESLDVDVPHSTHSNGNGNGNGTNGHLEQKEEVQVEEVEEITATEEEIVTAPETEQPTAYTEETETTDEKVETEVEAEATVEEEENTPAAPVAEENSSRIEEVSIPTVPTSLEDIELEHLAEEQLWERAEQLSSVSAYMDYINHTKESLHLADAYYMINKLSGDASKQEKSNVVTIATTSVEEVKEEMVEATKEEDSSAKEEVATPAEVEEVIVGQDNESAVEATATEDKVTEEELWAKATTLDSIEGYKDYLNNTEENTYLSDAYHRINQLNQKASLDAQEFDKEDDTIEEKIENTEVADTKAVIEELPTTVVEQEQPQIQDEEDADDILAREEEILWQEAQETHTMGAYFNYLNLTKIKKYWSEAKQCIKELKEASLSQEEQDWKNAADKDTVEAYKEYIKKYPLGAYYAKAMFRINHLEEQV